MKKRTFTHEGLVHGPLLETVQLRRTPSGYRWLDQHGRSFNAASGALVRGPGPSCSLEIASISSIKELMK